MGAPLALSATLETKRNDDVIDTHGTITVWGGFSHQMAMPKGFLGAAGSQREAQKALKAAVGEQMS